MKRELNETEKRVIETAKLLEKNPICGTWGATQIQILGWPESGNCYRAKELGISAAILYLRRRGFVKSFHRHGYRLTPNAKVSGAGTAAAGLPG